jgi:DNA-binding response OmpR family regulator
MSSDRDRILIAEDEPSLITTLTDRLEAEGFEVQTATDGEKALERALSGDFALVLLDVAMPKKNGLDVCRDLRQAGVSTPVLMLTARSQTVDKVVGLKLGADDYLTKPFEMIELLARIEALLRRGPQTRATPGVTVFDDVHIDFRAAEVSRDGRPVELSALEFKLLRYLVEHPREVLSRDRLLDEVWGYESNVQSRTVDVHIAQLRQKIEANPSKPARIVTVHGLGYKFLS